MLYQVESLFRVTVQVDDNHVEAGLQQVGYVVQLRICGKLLRYVGLRPSEGIGYRSSTLLLRTNQRNRHYVNVQHVGVFCGGRHHDIATPWFSYHSVALG